MLVVLRFFHKQRHGIKAVKWDAWVVVYQYKARIWTQHSSDSETITPAEIAPKSGLSDTEVNFRGNTHPARIPVLQFQENASGTLVL